MKINQWEKKNTRTIEKNQLNTSSKIVDSSDSQIPSIGVELTGQETF